MKSNAKMIEGAEAFTRFTSAMKHIVSVPREEIQRREAEYKAKAALSPKRGPKPKPSASRVPDAGTHA
jgi:hypothetical protein